MVSHLDTRMDAFATSRSADAVTESGEMDSISAGESIRALILLRMVNTYVSSSLLQVFLFYLLVHLPQWWKGTECIHTSPVVKCKFKVIVLCFQYFHFMKLYTSASLFTPLHSSDCFTCWLLFRLPSISRCVDFECF